MLAAQLVGLRLDLQRAADRVALHLLVLEHRDDLVADELVDVAVMLRDDVGLLLEVEVQHLDHGLGIVPLGERRIAADVAEQHGRAALLAAQPDPPEVGALDRRHGLGGDELGELEALAQPDHHVVHAPGQIADLVARADALRPGPRNCRARPPWRRDRS